MDWPVKANPYFHLFLLEFKVKRRLEYSAQLAKLTTIITQYAVTSAEG